MRARSAGFRTFETPSSGSATKRSSCTTSRSGRDFAKQTREIATRPAHSCVDSTDYIRKAHCIPQRMSGKRRMSPYMKAEELFVQSKPTTCLGCHLVVKLFHERDTDARSGAWQCPNCARRYPFSHWKIRKETPGKSEAD